MAQTPVYGWPFQALTDRPDGPNLGEDMAFAVEATVKSLELRLQQIEQSLPVLAASYRQRQILAGTQPSVTFSGIPTNLRRLALSMSARCDAAVQVAFLNVQINNDTGANYNFAYNQSINTASSGAAFAAQTNGIAGFAVGTSAQANHFAPSEAVFTGWDTPGARAGGIGWTFLSGGFGGTTANFDTFVGLSNYTLAGPWTAIKLFPGSGNFVAGCDFQLLGWGS